MTVSQKISEKLCTEQLYNAILSSRTPDTRQSDCHTPSTLPCDGISCKISPRMYRCSRDFPQNNCATLSSCTPVTSQGNLMVTPRQDSPVTVSPDISARIKRAPVITKAKTSLPILTASLLQSLSVMQRLVWDTLPVRTCALPLTPLMNIEMPCTRRLITCDGWSAAVGGNLNEATAQTCNHGVPLFPDYWEGSWRKTGGGGVCVWE